MRTITISRQLASLGEETARLVAGRLGFRLVQREIINQAARLAGAPEAALAEIDELGLLELCPSRRDCRAYHRVVRQVMEGLAAQGGHVIVGRAGQVILRDCPGVIRVRVYAPVDIRVDRVAAQAGVSRQAAEARVQTSDAHRRDYLRRFYHVSWDDPKLYDLMVNTARLSPPDAADLIASVVPREERRGEP